MRLKSTIFLVFCLLMVVGLAGSGGSVDAQEPSLDAEFEAAADEFGVPVGLLKSIGYVNTRWEMPPPDASAYEPGEIEARGNYGIMSLYKNPSRNTLGKAAKLISVSEEELKTDRMSNIRGGAALLAEAQGESKPEDVNDWYRAVAETWDGSLYANQVYETLKKGASTEISSGEKVVLEPRPEAETRSIFGGLSSADYGRATWYGASSSNYTSTSRGAAQINKVIVHVTQGSFSSAINWFQNSGADVSAHYTVKSSDGHVGQSVREKDIGWHAGNWDYNKTSIGIEHEGYVSESSWFTGAMYRSSARLTASLVKKYRIPIDRKHIIGHNEVPGATHTDPGRYWDWNRYMRLVKKYAGSGGYKQVVDNSSSRFSASKAWRLSSWNSQKRGKNYRYVKPRNLKRFRGSASFKLRIPKKSKYKVYARWPANPNYNSRTRFYVRTTNGWQRKIVNQRKNGGRWVRLGTYNMAAGDRIYVRIARKSKGKGYIIADAVMVKKA